MAPLASCRTAVCSSMSPGGRVTTPRIRICVFSRGRASLGDRHDSFGARVLPWGRRGSGSHDTEHVAGIAREDAVAVGAGSGRVALPGHANELERRPRNATRPGRCRSSVPTTTRIDAAAVVDVEGQPGGERRRTALDGPADPDQPTLEVLVHRAGGRSDRRGFGGGAEPHGRGGVGAQGALGEPIVDLAGDPQQLARCEPSIGEENRDARRSRRRRSRHRRGSRSAVSATPSIVTVAPSGATRASAIGVTGADGVGAGVGRRRGRDDRRARGRGWHGRCRRIWRRRRAEILRSGDEALGKVRSVVIGVVGRSRAHRRAGARCSHRRPGRWPVPPPARCSWSCPSRRRRPRCSRRGCGSRRSPGRGHPATRRSHRRSRRRCPLRSRRARGRRPERSALRPPTPRAARSSRRWRDVDDLEALQRQGRAVGLWSSMSSSDALAPPVTTSLTTRWVAAAAVHAACHVEHRRRRERDRQRAASRSGRAR